MGMKPHIPQINTNISETDVAWLAGLFEGEGNAFLFKNSFRITIQMTDEDIIYRLKEITGVGTICKVEKSKKNFKHIDAYRWQLAKRYEVVYFARLILPYLGQRRTKKIVEILEKLEDKNLI